jgi:hypothetical protein
MLLALEFCVISNDLFDDGLVRGWNVMMLQQVLITLVDRSPARNFLVKSQVAKDHGGGSWDSRTAMNEDFVVLTD